MLDLRVLRVAPGDHLRFGSKVGQLAGNHFLTIIEGAEHLPELGRLTLWQDAQTIEFTLV